MTKSLSKICKIKEFDKYFIASLLILNPKYLSKKTDLILENILNTVVAIKYFDFSEVSTLRVI